MCFRLPLPLQNATYQGTGTIRGHVCDVWETLYASSPYDRRLDWVFDDNNGTALPMRVKTERNDVTSLIDFENIYVGGQDVGNFMPPSFMVCTDESKMPIPMPVVFNHDTVFPMLAKA